MRSGGSDHVEQEEFQPRNGMEYLFVAYLTCAWHMLVKLVTFVKHSRNGLFLSVELDKLNL